MIYYFRLFFFNKYLLNIKVCLCTPVKDENRYIREFIEFYKNYGVDKIFLYDNNDIQGEKIKPIIMDYLNKGFIKIMNWRGKKKSLYPMMNDCYKKNYRHYDWIVFYEVDEYIHLKNYNNIKLYLNQEKFKKCQTIHLNWVYHTDNNLINYDNRKLRERFPEVEPKAKNNITNTNPLVKSIIKGNIHNITIDNVHQLNEKLKGCNGFGESQTIYGGRSHGADYSYYYIDHYFSKSLSEFVEKINKGDVSHYQAKWFKMFRISQYFSVNQLSLEKINYLENHTKLNLSKYRTKLTKNQKFKSTK